MPPVPVVRFADELVHSVDRFLHILVTVYAALVFADNVKLRVSYRDAVVFDDAPCHFGTVVKILIDVVHSVRTVAALVIFEHDRIVQSFI